MEGSRRFLRRLGNFPTSPDAAVRQAKQSIRGEYDPSTELIAVDVLLLATSNYPLDDPAWRAENSFQEPLYTRLATEYAGGPLHVPSLMERREDVPLLFEVLLKRATEVSGGVWPKQVTAEVAERLKEIDWPGDVAWLGGFARKVAEAAKDWEEVLLRHLPAARPSKRPVPPTEVHLPGTEQSAKSETITLENAVTRLKAVHLTGTRRELNGSLRDLDVAYGQLAQRLLEMALDATPEDGDARKDPSLGDLSPTKAIKLLLRVKKLTTTQAADEILRICGLFANPVPDNSDLGRVLAWAKKRRRGAKRSDTSQRLCLQPNNLKRKLAGWVVNFLRTSRQRSLNRPGAASLCTTHRSTANCLSFGMTCLRDSRRSKRKRSRRFSRRSRRTSEVILLGSWSTPVVGQEKCCVF